MASACVNNIGMSPESFLDCPPATYPSYGWLSPRISFSRDISDEASPSKLAGPKPKPKPIIGPVDRPTDASESTGPDPEPFAGDFEFRLDDPVTMLPADELFSDGKLVPLQLSLVKPSVRETTSMEVRSPDTAKCVRRNDISSTDPYVFSPKAPRCSSRWREILGLKKLYQNSNAKNENNKTTSSSSASSSSLNPKSLKYFLHRSTKSTSSAPSDASLSLPLLKDLDSESVSISSSRVSLSSSSSGHEHEDLPRLSLDSEKPSSFPNQNLISLHRNPNHNRTNPPRMRMVKPRAVSSENNSRAGRSPMRRAPGESSGITSRGVSIDSPRMNSSGKIVFHSLERSSSSPSSFNGGPRFKHRGMERSYSANVRVTPVINVPVCSLRGSSKSGSIFGFGQLFSSTQKRDQGTVNNGGTNRSHHSNTRNRSDRA